MLCSQEGNTCLPRFLLGVLDYGGNVVHFVPITSYAVTWPTGF